MWETSISADYRSPLVRILLNVGATVHDNLPKRGFPHQTLAEIAPFGKVRKLGGRYMDLGDGGYRPRWRR